jgi:hypothetical protein
VDSTGRPALLVYGFENARARAFLQGREAFLSAAPEGRNRRGAVGVEGCVKG